MPTLGAAQIVGFLRNEEISCRLYDINAEMIRQVQTRSESFRQPYRRLLGDDDNSFRSVFAKFNLLSALNDDFNMTVDNFKGNLNWRNPTEVRHFIKGDSEVIRILQGMQVLDEIIENSRFVGISISYEGQLILALAIAEIIKSRNPGVSVILGGSFFYNYEHEFYSLFCDVDAVDYVVIGPGEVVLKNLILAGMQAVSELPGIKTWEYSGRWLLDARELTRQSVVYEPDFTDVNFEQYPTVEKAFPYMIKNRCYYGKCYFCSGDKVIDAVQSKDVEKALESITQIASRIGIYNVYFVDAALAPNDFQKICMMPQFSKHKWAANARFDKPLLANGLLRNMAEHGCTMLRFGLESGSQRVLNLMNKGINIEVASAILQEASACGIKSHVYIMFGYPGETLEDRCATVEFLRAHRSNIFSYSISMYQPIPNTQTYQTLQRCISKEGNPYDGMLTLIYRDEDNYLQMIKDAKRVSEALKGYAKTNAEFYSANVFSPLDEESLPPIVIRPYMVVDRCDDLNTLLKLKCDFTLQQIDGMENGDFCTVMDLYKNIKIRLFIDKWLIEYLQKSFAGDEQTLCAELDAERRDILRELLQMIALNSYCVTWKNVHYAEAHRFRLQNRSAYNLGDMNIQFSPMKQLEDKECEIWKE